MSASSEAKRSIFWSIIANNPNMRSSDWKLHWRFWRPSRRRYFRIHLCRFLEAWWNVTWLYLGFIAALSAFVADSVTVEPTVMILCTTMILTVRNLRDNQVVSILTAVLGALAVLLLLPARYEVGAFTLGLWVVNGVLVLASAFSTIILMLAWFTYCEPWRQRRRQQRQRRRRQRRGS